MSAVNRISKYNLEERVRSLNESGVSLRDIADTLTTESGHQISKDSVFSFLKNDIKFTAEIIEHKTALKAAVAEAEVSTIQGRLNIIEKLNSIFETATNEEDTLNTLDICALSKELREHYDSLDKRLGKLTGAGVTINNINALKLSDIPTEQLLRMVNVTDR